MKAIVQRVTAARVVIDEETVGEIEAGLLLYVCFETGDTLDTIEQLIQKIINLRIFEDEQKKMNLNILQHTKQILSVSQFTLSWDGKKGHRPSFDKSMSPNQAKVFYRKFNDRLEELGIILQKGIFGCDMLVHSIGDGPVSFFLDFE